jgi:hypothetical protein
MAHISREFFETLKKNKLIEHGDWIALERLSREVGLKDGNGVVASTFRNAVIKGFTTTEEVVALVQGYFKPKSEAAKEQKKLVKEMKEKLASV